MRWMQIFLTLFLTTISVSQGKNALGQPSPLKHPISHEEEIVRVTYARLSYAAQVNDIHTLWLEKGKRQQIDPIQFKLRLDQHLRFELTDFKVGPITEILSVKYKDLVTKPSSSAGDSLDVGTGHIGGSNSDAQGNRTESSSTIAQVRWIPTQDIKENWDFSFGTIYPLTEEAGKHQRYASFEVKATFQGRSRIYRAMFLFGPNGQPILPIDTVININGGALTRFIAEDPYPGTLIEGGLANKDPLIRGWLEMQQTTGGKSGEVYCDLDSVRCGVNQEDFNKLKPIRYKPRQHKEFRLVGSGFHSYTQPAHAILQSVAPTSTPTTCADYNKSFNLPPGSALDATYHLGPEFHAVTVLKTSSCLYSNGTSANGNCDTECSVTTPTLVDEGGGFLSSFCHATGKDIDNSHATATAVGDAAKCGGAGGGAVKACFACTCNVSITVTKSPLGITLSTDGFFSFKDGLDGACPAQAMPPTPANGCDPTSTSDFTANQDSPTNCDPVLLDLKGNGFDLTSAANGVIFDIRATGHPFNIPWTNGTEAAFLVLDRNRKWHDRRWNRAVFERDSAAAIGQSEWVQGPCPI
jgi:hypothetical protein